MFPRALSVLGAALGAAGIVSMVTVFGEVRVVFGVLLIVWLLWLARALEGA